jgi:DUF1365 family protein
MTPDRSAVYEGTVFHRRLEPIGHALRYPLRMPLLDLGELARRPGGTAGSGRRR